jgi:hypothetical protein
VDVQPTIKQIAIRVDAPLRDRIQKIARQEHNGVAAVCRRLLTAALDQEEADDDRERRAS